MADDRDELRRLDLRVLDIADDALRHNEIARAVMGRITTIRPLRADWWLSLLGAQRRLAAVAAVLLLVAGAVLFADRQTRGDGLTELIEDWAKSSHIPTNGELLAAYQGYSR
jgi:hypothetical protein